MLVCMLYPVTLHYTGADVPVVTIFGVRPGWAGAKVPKSRREWRAHLPANLDCMAGLSTSEETSSSFISR